MPGPDYEGGNTYFALEEDPLVLATRAMARLQAFREDMVETGRVGVILDAHDMYFSRDRNGQGDTPHRVREAGQRGEVLIGKFPHLAALCRLLRTITTAQLPDTEPSAGNSNEAAESATLLARDLLLDYRVRQQLDTAFILWVQQAILYNWGWLWLDWDATGGAKRRPPPGQQLQLTDFEHEVDPDTKQQVFATPKPEGEVKWTNLTALDVAVDINRTNNRHDWVVATTLCNRWELAHEVSRQPAKDAEERAQRIIDWGKGSRTSTGAAGKTEWPRLNRGYRDSTARLATDLVAVQTLMHRPTVLLPDGLRFRFLASDLMVDAAPVPLGDDKLNIHQLCPEVCDDTPYGHSPMQDLQGSQEAVDAVMSTALTRQRASLPKLVVPAEAGVDTRRLENAYTAMEYKGGAANKPEIFQFSNDTAPDIALAEHLVGGMQGISSLSPALRGDRAPGQSGSSSAFQSSQSILANKNFQDALHAGMGAAGMSIIRLHRRNGSFPRALRAAAGGDRLVRFFLGTDLAPIESVSVKTVGVLRQDPQGRMSLLSTIKELAGPQFAFPPDKVLLFAETGRFEEVTDPEKSEDLYIKAQVEQLRQGKPVFPAHWAENAVKHIKAFRQVLFSDMAKANPAIVKAVEDAIASYEQAWGTAPPAYLKALGLPGPPLLEELQPGMHSAAENAGAPPPGAGGPPGPSGAGGPPSGGQGRGPGPGPQQGPPGPTPAGGPPPAQAQLPRLPNGASSAPLAHGQLPAGALP